MLFGVASTDDIGEKFKHPRLRPPFVAALQVIMGAKGVIECFAQPSDFQ